MKELFDESGHLTDYALNCLRNDELDELSRLEISEHLSFCDKCLLHYMDSLDSQELIEAPQLLEKSVINKIKQNSRKEIMRQYTQMAIAASFALIFWISGVFNPLRYDTTTITAVSSGVSSTTQQFGENITNGINKILNMDLKGVNGYEKE